MAQDLVAAGYESGEELLAGMDRHAAQKTLRMKQLYTELGMVPVFTPPGCTDCVSPVDHHVGRQLQNYMAKPCYQAEVAKDGSEDGLVSLQGWEGTEKYKFR